MCLIKPFLFLANIFFSVTSGLVAPSMLIWVGLKQQKEVVNAVGRMLVTLCLTLLSNVGNFLRKSLQKCTCKACLIKSVSKLCTSQFDIRTRLSHHSVSAGMLIKVLEATRVDIGSGPRCNISCGSRAHSCLFAHFQIFPTSVNLFDSRWPWDMWLCVQITLNHNDSLPFCDDEQHSSLLCVLVEKQEKKELRSKENKTKTSIIFYLTYCTVIMKLL